MMLERQEQLQQILQTPWHTLENKKVLKGLDTDIDGIDDDEVQRRLVEYGPNIISQQNKISMLSIFIDQFKNYLVLILIAAASISVWLGHLIDGIAIYVIVMFAVILGFSQEYKADKAIEALLESTSPTTEVVRSGKISKIPSVEVVPGDIILLDVGDKIPADARLLEVYNLQVDEASLTGEFIPITKSIDIVGKALALGDRTNMVYAGTIVSQGRARAIVVKTGLNTEFGKIAKQLDSITKEETPLQGQIDRLGKKLTLFSFILITIVFAVGLIQGEDPVRMFVWSISLAVAVVPEALPAIITISLAIGVQKMSKKNALVRKLPAVETLGSTTIICSDKTGTITEGKMAVKEVFMGLEKLDFSYHNYMGNNFNFLVQASNLCNNVTVNNLDTGNEYLGNPTEIAIMKFVKSLDHPLESDDRIDEIGFSSERKLMSTVNRINDDLFVFSKGAPEIIIQKSTAIMIDGEPIPLDDEILDQLNSITDKMGSDALRSIAMAYKPINKGFTRKEIESDLILLGIFGLNDPPKPNVKETIQECNNVGIRTMMITGDHLITANAIAREVGILRPEGISLQGEDLDTMSDDELMEKIDHLDVVARVSPSHKLRLVNVIKSKGHVVAMTGDGINDAPALKAANVGVAMGSGTAVSKEASDMILADDGFDTIVVAIQEGRLIYDNIKKYLMFLLSSNLGEILLLSVAIFAGMGMPILAIHILYINLASDGLPALALAFDPPADSKLSSKPRDPDEDIFSRPVIKLLILGGVASAVINAGIFLFALNVLNFPIEQAQIIVFVNLVLIQFVKAYSYRSERHSILYYKPFTNKWLNYAVLWEIILLVIIIYNKTMQSIFNTYDLRIFEWLLILSSSLTILPILEFGKWYFVRSDVSELDAH